MQRSVVLKRVAQQIEVSLHIMIGYLLWVCMQFISQDWRKQIVSSTVGLFGIRYAFAA